MLKITAYCIDIFSSCKFNAKLRKKIDIVKRSHKKRPGVMPGLLLSDMILCHNWPKQDYFT